MDLFRLKPIFPDTVYNEQQKVGKDSDVNIPKELNKQIHNLDIYGCCLKCPTYQQQNPIIVIELGIFQQQQFMLGNNIN